MGLFRKQSSSQRQGSKGSRSGSHSGTWSKSKKSSRGSRGSSKNPTRAHSSTWHSMSKEKAKANRGQRGQSKQPQSQRTQKPDLFGQTPGQNRYSQGSDQRRSNSGRTAMRKAGKAVGGGRSAGHSRAKGKGKSPGRAQGKGSSSSKGVLGTILKVLLLLVLLAGVAFGVRACINRGWYNWDHLQSSQDAGYLSYQYGKKETNSLVGVDVSEYQGQIDWNAVAGSGIQFAIVRIGNRGSSEGYIYIDEQYSNNIDGARVAGLPVGVYFFSQATSVAEAEEEADYVLNMLNGTDIQLPVFYDHEPTGDDGGRAAGIDEDVLTQATLAFCSRIEDGGYKAMYYGNSHMFDKVKMRKLKDFGFWYAEYGVSAPSINSGFLIWQYASDGLVPGIPASVDLDLILDREDFGL